MESLCPNAEKCPIFNEILLDKVVTSKWYKTHFCEGGEANWNNCKRFITKKQYGMCPADLLPNSSLTIEQIAEKYNLVIQS
jgi:hypothetical protein